MCNMKKFIVFTDGASRGNPGLAAAGIVIKTEDGVIWVQDGKFLGTTTNNVAEYSAVIFALEKLVADFSNVLPAKVEFIVDSMLIANQLSGTFKIKNEGLKELFIQVKQLEQKVGQVTYTYTPRANNVLADKMANQAIDNHLFNGN
jgi:ribonuclease HI